ncbi:MAG: hypothetical protein QM731_10035 [Chitinophagaceae bacterium]
MTNFHLHASSFKDPSGFIFVRDKKIYRQVNAAYAATYNTLKRSGLYDTLVKQKQLVPHTEINEDLTQTGNWHLTLQPETIEYISYPYEWSFDQLKDAALLTLQTLKTAVDHGMILKDATPFNIQFKNGNPVLIDTLSFEEYNETEPWVAYRQFCECFLFPLYLEHYLQTGMQPIQRAYFNGISADLTARLLPSKSKWSLGVWLHVHLQRSIGKNNNTAAKYQSKFNKQKLLNLIRHLEQIITRLRPSSRPTTWSNYYQETILDQAYLKEKERLFLAMLQNIHPQTALDLGANDGYFSKLMAQKEIQVISTDFDHRCINDLYLHCKANDINNILPLINDITDPSPALGFSNTERSAFDERIHAELVTALALIHHLAIGKNIPLPLLAQYFNSIAPLLIIEFVPKTDPKVQQILSGRKDVFDDYNETAFEKHFSNCFSIEQKTVVTGTQRTLYLMKRKGI